MIRIGRGFLEHLSVCEMDFSCGKLLWPSVCLWSLPFVWDAQSGGWPVSQFVHGSVCEKHGKANE